MGRFGSARVYCRTEKVWCDAEVTAFQPEKVTVQFELGERYCRKTLWADSEDLRISEEARRALVARGWKEEGDDEQPASPTTAGMLDLTTSCAGSYSDVVAALTATLQNEAKRNGGFLIVTVVGHGGRDTNCSLAVVEAATRCGIRVFVRVLTCSWPDDGWEPVLQQFLASMHDRGAFGRAEVELEVLKFGEEPEQLLHRLRAGLRDAHLIVQCEQGVDFFVEPTSEWLQDNFEDYFVHACCMALAEARGIPVWLLETNADLDLVRGINSERVAELMGSLQTNVFGKVALRFEQRAGQEPVESPPRNFVELCTKIGGAKSKREAFATLLALDLDGTASAPGNFYTKYMCYAAQATDATLPVAGVMELAVALRKGGHSLPWSCDTLPDPQWVLARCLRPPGIAVVTEMRHAKMDTAPTYAAFLGRWMSARNSLRGPRTHNVAAGSRFAGHFWSQLELAQEVATTVRQRRPDLDLWTDGPKVVTKALERFAVAAQANEELESDRLKQEQKAKKGQPSFGTLSPLFRWVQAHLIHVIDFSLRLLSAKDMDAEFQEIVAGLPQRPEKVQHGGAIRPLCAQLFADALAESPRAEAGMLDLATSCAGSYSDAVAALTTTLKDEAKRHDSRLNVSVVGHGGRDTNCSLAVIEAAARCGVPVFVRVLTCSWWDDGWEPVLQQFLASMHERGAFGIAQVELEVLKFGEEPAQLLRELRTWLRAAHLIVQCEQGVDFFVGPTSEWLQDNFEDYFVHACCMAQAEARGTPVWLLQTNSDLDLVRGISSERVAALMGSLQTNVFGKVALEFEQRGVQEAAEAPPRNFVELCVKIGSAKSKRQAFETLLALDLDGAASAPGNFYTKYMCYAAKATDATLPVAGVMELAVALRKGGHSLPWSCDKLPDPQWVFAQCLPPPGVAVVTEMRNAEMDTAPTYAAFLGRWMSARHKLRGPRTHCVDAGSRFAGHFWSQLELAQEVATSVRQRRPDLDLWSDGPKVVTKALERFAVAAQANEELEDDRLKNEQKAKTGQSSFGTLSPNWRWLQAHMIHIIEFSLRLLSAKDMDAEFQEIVAGLPQRPAKVQHGGTIRPLCAQLFADALAESPHA